jgi:hypothetical protein
MLRLSELAELLNAVVGLYRGAYSMHRVLTDRECSDTEINQLLKTPLEDLLLDTVQNGHSITLRSKGNAFVPTLTTAALLAAALTGCDLGVRHYYETLKLNRMEPDIEKIDQRLGSGPAANRNRYEHDLAWHFCDLQQWRKRPNTERVSVRTLSLS